MVGSLSVGRAETVSRTDGFPIPPHGAPGPGYQSRNWIATQNAESLFINVITLGELRRALLLPLGKKRRGLLRWIETGIKAAFAGRILPLKPL